MVDVERVRESVCVCVCICTCVRACTREGVVNASGSTKETHKRRLQHVVRYINARPHYALVVDRLTSAGVLNLLFLTSGSSAKLLSKMRSIASLPNAQQ